MLLSRPVPPTRSAEVAFAPLASPHSSSRSSPQASPSRSREVSRQSRSRRGRLVARPFSYTPLMSSRSGSLIRRVASRSPTRSCSTRCSSSAPSDELDAAVGQAVLPRRHPTHRSCVASLSSKLSPTSNVLNCQFGAPRVENQNERGHPHFCRLYITSRT